MMIMDAVVILLLTCITMSLQCRQDADRYHLPGDMFPIHYNINIHTHIDVCRLNVKIPCLYELEETIYLYVEKPTKEIVLNSHSNTVIKTASIEKIGYNLFKRFGNPTYMVTLGKFSPDTQMQHFYVSHTLEPGQYKLYIAITGVNTLDNKGFALINDEINTPNEYLLSTYLEPADARRIFPCFDEPRFKATFSCVVDISQKLYEEGYHVLSGTPIIASYPKGGSYVYEFKETALMSTYLLVIIVSNYKSTEATSFISKGKPTPYRTWGPNHLMIRGSGANVSQTIGPKIMDKYQEIFGLDYVFEKLDQISIPHFLMGAMENWGLIVYREAALFPKEDDLFEEKLVGMLTIAHEMGHQWFGNLVTNSWWSYTWLNEGFATFCESVVLSKMGIKDFGLSESVIMSRFISGVFQEQALLNDERPNSESLSHPVDNPKLFGAKFGPVTYGKGGSVIRMWMHCLGEDLFMNAIRLYLRTNAFATTVPESIMWAFDTVLESNNMQQILPAPPAEVFGNWHLLPHYPVLFVSKNANTLIITQCAYIVSGNPNCDSPLPSNWYIPVTYSTSRENLFNYTYPMAYLKRGESSLEIPLNEPCDWYLLNNQVTGFYRVNYDIDNWIALVKALNNKEIMHNIHPFNRGQILDDAYQLSLWDAKNNLPMTIPLSMSSYLINEPSIVPWRAFGRNIKTILSILDENSQNKLHHDVAKFALSIVSAAMDNLESIVTNDANGVMLNEYLPNVFYVLSGEADGTRRGKGFLSLLESRLTHGSSKGVKDSIKYYNPQILVDQLNDIENILEWALKKK